jgi:glycine/D-amino acid oxidase-like deaminating enzyme
MTNRADVIIVGGGITGLSTALHLRQRGVTDVVVLERHFVGSGQSGRAAGVIRATVQHPIVSATQLEGQAFFESYESRYGIPLSVNRVGYLLVAQSHEREYVERTAEVATQSGCVLSRIDANEAADLQPGLDAEDEGIYLYEPGAIYVDPMPATHAMLLAAKALGVTVIDGCEVNSIRVERDKVTGVDTERGRFEAPNLLIATSVWGQPQLAALGIKVPVLPHIAQMAFYHVPPASPLRLRRIIFDSRANLYMRPEHDTQLFVGRKERDFVEKNGNPIDPDNYRQTATHQAIADMSRSLAVTLPFMNQGFVHRTYACTYDITPDDMPILDQSTTIRGLYFAVGFSGGGFSTSPWVGQRMAAFIAESSRPADLRVFSLQRFAKGELVQWSNTPI